MLFPLQQSITFMIPVSFVHCQGFLRNLSMSLHTNRWHMAYFLCNFQGFPLLWAASAKLLKKLQFPSFQWVSLPFSNLSFALGRSIRDNCWKSCNFHPFPTAAKHHFYDYIALRGPNPVSFVHCQGFLRNLSVSLHTNRWHMAYFLCNFQGFPLLWAASAISFLSMGFSAIFQIFLCFGRLLPKMLKKLYCPGFLRILSMSLIKANGTWLIFSAMFKVFLCFGRLLLKCWKSCYFHAFPIAAKHHFYDFIALRGPNPVSFVHCQGFLRNLSMSLHTNRWHMAYFLCNFQGFPLLWAASAKLLKKLQFPSFQWVSLPFSNLSFALGRSIRDNCWKSCNFHAFPTAAKHHFYDPSFFRPLPRFPAEFEHVTTYKQMAYGLFSLQFSRFSFALGGFCQIVEKVAVSILSMGFFAVF